jgi:hypothetical protein
MKTPHATTMIKEELAELTKRGIEDIIATATATIDARAQANAMCRARNCPLRAKVINDANHRHLAEVATAATKVTEANQGT